MAVFFVTLILLPAGILTYLSARAFQDEQRSALADLHLKVPDLRSAFEAQLRDVSDRSFARVAANGPDSAAYRSVELKAAFTLDETGEFEMPRVVRARLQERTGAYAETLAQAEEVEFGDSDYVAASSHYRRALAVAVNDGERAEVLNALGRCAVSTADLARALDYFEQIQAYPRTLDPDGAHPLTLSVVRLANWYLDGDSTMVAAGFDLTTEWSAAVLRAEYPVHDGTRLAARQLKKAIRRYGWRRETSHIKRDLGRIEELTDWVAVYQYVTSAASDYPILVRRGIGLWRERADLPDFEALRREFDRNAHGCGPH